MAAIEVINNNSCTFTYMFNQMIHFKDFHRSIDNPFFLAYGNNITLNNIHNKSNLNNIHSNPFKMTFLSFSFAYSIFRVLMTLTILIYGILKINHIEKKSWSIVKYAIKEIRIYRTVVIAALGVDFLMSIHNLIFWRGLQYFTSYQDTIFEKFPSVIQAGYLKRIRNCIYSYDPYKFFYQGNVPKSQYLIFFISLWIFFEFCSIFVISFSVLMLSRINRRQLKRIELIKSKKNNS